MSSSRVVSEPPAAEALEPYRPGIDGPWDRELACHLSRRAGFGMPEATVARLIELGPRRAAAALLERQPENADIQAVTRAGRNVAGLAGTQAEWVYRMLFGGNPALEKLVLFWHGHFATSVRKVDDVRLMARQIELFREMGRGPFPELLQAVARDPAMLIWLDGNANRRGQPNENFARELMELFALGIGRYSEADIKEAARAFTGWHVRDDEFWFNERAHDRGTKQVLGAAGDLDGADVVRLCAESKACAEFVAAKLFEFYVYRGPSPELRRELGRAFTAARLRVGDFLAELLSARVFYSGRARRALVASPADFAIGSLRTLGARAGCHAVARAMADMGQELLAPPSVKGWDMGQAWLTSATLLARFAFAMSLASPAEAAGLGDLNPQVPWDSLGRDQNALIRRFFPEGLEAPVVAKLDGAAEGDPRALVVCCLELPEYQFV